MKTEVDRDTIAGAINIIDECARRGAFKGEELSTIGVVRDSLMKYFQEVEEKTKKTVETDDG